MRPLSLALLAALLIAAPVQSAQLRTTLVRTYTSLPNDPAPNIAPLAPTGTGTWTPNDFVVHQMGTGSSNQWEKESSYGWMVMLTHDGTGGALDCTVTPWAYDYGSASWGSFSPDLHIAAYQWMDDVRNASLTLYWQVVCAAGPTVSAGHPVTIRAGAR